MFLICKKCTEVIKEQNVNVKDFSSFLSASKLPVKRTLPARKHRPKISCHCPGEAYVLYQSFRELEIK